MTKLWLQYTTILLISFTALITADDDPEPVGDNVCTVERDFVTQSRERYTYDRPHREEYPCWDPTKVL